MKLGVWLHFKILQSDLLNDLKKIQPTFVQYFLHLIKKFKKNVKSQFEIVFDSIPYIPRSSNAHQRAH